MELPHWLSVGKARGRREHFKNEGGGEGRSFRTYYTSSFRVRLEALCS